MLERAAKETQIMEAEAWRTTRTTVPEALSRSEEAQQHRWQLFRHTLSIPLLREIPPEAG